MKMKVIIDSTKRNKHQVFVEKNSKRILIKEFKTLEEAINFTKREGGIWEKYIKQKGGF